MKTHNAIKKVLFAVMVLVLFSVSQARAGSVTLAGQVDFVDNGFAISTIGVNDPISLELTWDGVVGTEWVTFDGGLNTMTLTIDNNVTITEGHKGASDPSPAVHFTDGVFDDFNLSFFGFSAILGGVDSFWSIDAGFSPGLGAISVGFEDINMLQMQGTVDMAPVPLPGGVWLFGSGLIGLVGVRRRMK